MFTTTATFTVGVEEELFEEIGEELPQLFELGQNYPNPFNPTTTFEFRMGATANVSIRVFNVLGQVVRTLVDGTMSIGVHRVTWDARDDSGTTVATGLYLYQMETSGFQSVKTLVLMK
jgi:hypothetical protein